VGLNSDKLRKLFGLRREDLSRAVWMSAYNFCMGLTSILLTAIGDSLFLGKFRGSLLGFSDLEVLPVVQAISSGIYLIFNSARIRYASKLPLHYYLCGTMAIVASISAVYCGLLSFGSPPPIVYPLLLVWMEIVFIAVPLNTELIGNRLFDPRQAKRVYPVAMTGFYLACAFGALAIAALASHVAIEHLLWGAPVATIVGLLCYLQLRRLAPDVLDVAPTRSDATDAVPVRELLRSRFFLAVCGLTFFVVALFYLTDFQFKAYAGLVFDTEALSVFFGQFYMLLGLAQVLLQSFVSQRLLLAFGLFFCLAILPGFAIAISIATFAVPSAAAFALMTAFKGGDYLARTLFDSTRPLLFQAIPTRQREAMQSISNGIVWPLATISSGVVLLAYNALLPVSRASLQQLSLVMTVCGVALLGLVFLAQRDYLSGLLALSSRSRQLFRLTRPWPASVYAFLESCLTSANAGDVLWALNQYQAGDRPPEPTQIACLLEDARSDGEDGDNGENGEWRDVRLAAIETIARLPVESLQPALYARLDRTHDPAERETLARAVVTLDRDRAIADLWDRFRRTTDDRLRAQLGLLAFELGPIESHVSFRDDAFAAIADWIDGSDLDLRVAATRWLGYFPNISNRDWLRSALAEPSTSLRVAAIDSIARLGLRSLYPAALDRLFVGAQRSEIFAACTRLGAAAIPAIVDRWQASDRPSELAVLVRLLERLDCPTALEALCQLARDSAPRFGKQAIVGVVFARQLDRYTDRRPDAIVWGLDRAFDRAACELARLLAVVDWWPRRAGDVLDRAIATDIDNWRAMLLLSLAARQPLSAIRSVYFNWTSGDRGKTIAVEILDNLLTGSQRDRVIGLLEGDRDRPTTIAPTAAPSAAVARDMQTAIATASPWLRQVLARAFFTSTADPIAALPTATRTAIAAGLQADPAIGDVSPDATTMTEPLLPHADASLSILNRVVLLGQTPLFSAIADDILGEVAAYCREDAYAAEQVVFYEGDRGQCLYAIASGRVAIVKGETILRELDRGACFGEMSILDAEVRSATVRTIEPTVLLALDGEDFLALLQSEPDIANGILRVLTARVRDLSQRLA